MVITDLDGSQSTITDNASIVEDTDDSNINVFEFGNLILADILPGLGWFITRIIDNLDSNISVVDASGSTMSITDQVDGSNSVVDITGS